MHYTPGKSAKEKKMNTWEIYFASLVAMTLHPGYTRPETPRPSLDELAELADEMMKYKENKEEQTWQ